MSAVAVADQLMTMEFQCEFGPEATSDSQLPTVLESAGQATRTDPDCRQRSERGCLWADRQ